MNLKLKYDRDDLRLLYFKDKASLLQFAEVS